MASCWPGAYVYVDRIVLNLSRDDQICVESGSRMTERPAPAAVGIQELADPAQGGVPLMVEKRRTPAPERAC
jgi:hypothetical protein